MDRIILEKRLISFSTKILTLCKNCEFDVLTQHLARQLVRSSSSTALNYGEAQSAESRPDFAHKLGLVLKELRESFINLKLINEAGICRQPELLEELMKENDELIAIFQKSVNTLKSGLSKKGKEV